jgi:hypothetical protein
MSPTPSPEVGNRSSFWNAVLYNTRWWTKSKTPSNFEYLQFSFVCWSVSAVWRHTDMDLNLVVFLMGTGIYISGKFVHERLKLYKHTVLVSLLGSSQNIFQSWKLTCELCFDMFCVKYCAQMCFHNWLESYSYVFINNVWASDIDVCIEKVRRSWFECWVFSLKLREYSGNVFCFAQYCQNYPNLSQL